MASSHSAALCQVFDSIFLDVPMSKVKFNVNTEYAYIQNFKVLQSGFSLPSLPQAVLQTAVKDGGLQRVGPADKT